jgi:hypothetical protein
VYLFLSIFPPSFLLVAVVFIHSIILKLFVTIDQYSFNTND